MLKLSKVMALVVITALTIFLPVVMNNSQAPPNHPNVLVIVLDDNNNWLGHLDNHPDALTPNIDALASRGVSFRNAYANGIVCNSSRASFLTSTMPETNGVLKHGPPYLNTTSPHLVTLNEHFLDNGYNVYGTGKVFHFNNANEEWTEYFVTDNVDPHPMRPMNGYTHTSDLAAMFNMDWGRIDIPANETPDGKAVT